MSYIHAHFTVRYKKYSCTKVTVWMLADARFPRAHKVLASATGCELCRGPLPDFSDVYFFIGPFVADVAFMLVTSVRYRH
jgi:hypothetical protein